MAAITMPTPSTLVPLVPQPQQEQPRAAGCICWPVCWCASKGEAR